MDDALERLQTALNDIAEELADLAHAKLREVVETQSAEAAADERRLSRARRSVVKAAALLGAGPGDDDG
jgi:hypothetical protein